MRLYTYQSPEVISQLWRDRQYRPSWDRCVWLTGDIGTFCCFNPAYRWLVEQYSKRRPRFATEDPLVWWYTHIDQARKELHHERGLCLFGAEVPDERILLHDADAWYAVLGNYPYNHTQPTYDILSYEELDRREDLYRKPENDAAKRVTWENIFHLPRRDRQKQTIHAVTDCILLEWLEDGKVESL
jgi:hypothetical protein